MIRFKKQRTSRTKQIRNARKWISQHPGSHHFAIWVFGQSGPRAAQGSREGKLALRMLETAYGSGRILVVRGIPDYERDMVTIEVSSMWEPGWEPEPPPAIAMLH